MNLVDSWIFKALIFVLPTYVLGIYGKYLLRVGTLVARHHKNPPQLRTSEQNRTPPIAVRYNANAETEIAVVSESPNLGARSILLTDASISSRG